MYSSSNNSGTVYDFNLSDQRISQALKEKYSLSFYDVRQVSGGIQEEDIRSSSLRLSNLESSVLRSVVI